MDPPAQQIDPADHLDWAANIARKQAHAKFLRGQEVEDVVSVAHVALYEYAARSPEEGGFDPRKAVDKDLNTSFRVRAYLFVYGKCVDAAEEMQGGGTFRTVRSANLKKVGVLGDAAELISLDPREMPAVVRPPEPDTMDRPHVAVVAGLTISGPTAERLARLLQKPPDPTATAKPQPLRPHVPHKRTTKYRKGRALVDPAELPDAVPADELLPGFADRFHEVFDQRGRAG